MGCPRYLCRHQQCRCEKSVAVATDRILHRCDRHNHHPLQQRSVALGNGRIDLICRSDHRCHLLDQTWPKKRDRCAFSFNDNSRNPKSLRRMGVAPDRELVVVDDLHNNRRHVCVRSESLDLGRSILPLFELSLQRSHGDLGITTMDNGYVLDSPTLTRSHSGILSGWFFFYPKFCYHLSMFRNILNRAGSHLRLL